MLRELRYHTLVADVSLAGAAFLGAASFFANFTGPEVPTVPDSQTDNDRKRVGKYDSGHESESFRDEVESKKCVPFG